MKYQIILIDDGSEQDILSLIQDLPIYYIKHSLNLGQGAALQTGMDFAKLQQAGIVVHFDADGQHQSSDIPVMIKPILERQADIVIGSRFMKKGKAEGISKLKRQLITMARIINKLFTGLWFTDAHNGFRALSSKALSCIDLKEPGMAHATEILQQIKQHKLRVVEVPVHIRYTIYSKAKGQSNWNAINILLDLLKRRIL